MSKFIPSQRPRALGALLLLLFVFGQAYAAGHFALERHEVCVVDGELAHAEHDHGSEHAATHGTEPDAEDALVPATDTGGEHAEHCGAELLFEQRKCLTGSSAILAELSFPGTFVRALRTQAHGSRIPILSFAPKQSPPRAA